MKCQNLFSGKNKKNIINLLSVGLAQRVVKINNITHTVKKNVQEAAPSQIITCNDMKRESEQTIGDNK